LFRLITGADNYRLIRGVIDDNKIGELLGEAGETEPAGKNF
jgi:hypothetical protein